MKKKLYLIQSLDIILKSAFLLITEGCDRAGKYAEMSQQFKKK